MNYSEGLDFIENIIDALSPSVSLNTFFNAISDKMDSYLVKQKNMGKSFLGGKIYFSLSNDRKKIIIEVQLYYNTREKGFIKQEFSGQFWFNRIHISGQKEFINMLNPNGNLCVEVSEPS